jgi:hypothetical protein
MGHYLTRDDRDSQRHAFKDFKKRVLGKITSDTVHVVVMFEGTKRTFEVFVY